MLFSYHVHSLWSDGKSEIRDMVIAGRDKGLSELGISDHYVLTPGREQMEWSMPIDDIDGYVEAVQTASGEAGEEMIVRLGLEVDFIPETAADLATVLSSQPFDYVIGSVHIINGFPVDGSIDDWKPLGQKERDEANRTYWIRIREMAESGLFDIAGHLDLCKKFALYPSIDLSAEIEAALDAISVSGMSVELNTAGWYMPCGEEYPNTSILRGCLKRNIPILVSADAHVPENLVRGYGRAYNLLKEIGFTEMVSYAGRQKFPCEIPSGEMG
ncbi:MAG TPA: histidinol-phosphatase HisJ family protein [Armatimonadota bacterium]|jgi:histidinol-phosphatase (PHP family)